MIRIVSALYFILLLMTTGNAVAAKQCGKIFPSFKMTAEIQKSIDSTIAALAELRLNIDLAQAQGKSSIDRSVLANNYSAKENVLAEYLVQNKVMTEAELKDKIKKEILSLQGKKKKTQPKEDVSEEIRRTNMKIRQHLIVDGSIMIFHPVKPGSFMMGDPPQQKVTLTKPFEMMATTTTQIMWKTVADLYNSKLLDKTFGQVEINPDPSKFKGERNPVENVKYDVVKVWISALNKLSEEGEPALASLIRGHKKGDTYLLPTEAQWEFVIRGRGQFNEKYHFGEDPKPLDAYAWTEENSKSQTHPVAKKLPVTVDGHDFFDMMGNVQQMVADNYAKNSPGGIDPYIFIRGSKERLVRGSTWSAHEFYTGSAARAMVYDNTGTTDTGFRLVREVKP